MEKCKCVKSLNNGKFEFRVNDSYQYKRVPTSGMYPPVYEIYCNDFDVRTISHNEFTQYFRRAM